MLVYLSYVPTIMYSYLNDVSKIDSDCILSKIVLEPTVLYGMHPGNVN